MPEHTIIKPVIADKFNKFIKNGRIFFLSAPCGFGKTVLTDALLQGKKILRLNADTADFSSVSAKKKWDILQRMKEESTITQVKLMEEFNLTRKQVQKIIKDLREDGLVERQGSNRSGKWIVKK